MKRKLLSMGLILAVCLGAATLYGEDAPAEAGKAQTAPKVEKASDSKTQIAKLRGKLLYKKNVIRKLEKSACEVNSDLKEKVESMEKERRNQFVAAEPKLEALYEEQDALEKEIQTLSDKEKK